MLVLYFLDVTELLSYKYAFNCICMIIIIWVCKAYL